MSTRAAFHNIINITAKKKRLGFSLENTKTLRDICKHSRLLCSLCVQTRKEERAFVSKLVKPHLDFLSLEQKGSQSEKPETDLYLAA